MPPITAQAPRAHIQPFEMDRFFLLIAAKREATLFKYIDIEGTGMIAPYKHFPKP